MALSGFIISTGIFMMPCPYQSINDKCGSTTSSKSLIKPRYWWCRALANR